MLHAAALSSSLSDSFRLCRLLRNRLLYELQHHFHGLLQREERALGHSGRKSGRRRAAVCLCRLQALQWVSRAAGWGCCGGKSCACEEEQVCTARPASRCPAAPCASICCCPPRELLPQR